MAKVKRKIKSKEKPGLRVRIHYWFCDRLNIVSLDEFFGYTQQMDEYLKAQNNFNKVVGKHLHLNMTKDKEFEKDNKDRGMFG